MAVYTIWCESELMTLCQDPIEFPAYILISPLFHILLLVFPFLFLVFLFVVLWFVLFLFNKGLRFADCIVRVCCLLSDSKNEILFEVTRLLLLQFLLFTSIFSARTIGGETPKIGLVNRVHLFPLGLLFINHLHCLV